MIQALFLIKRVDKWSDLEELKESGHPSHIDIYGVGQHCEFGVLQ